MQVTAVSAPPTVVVWVVSSLQGRACSCDSVSLAQIGLWNDKALQDVSGKSALTPPMAFYGPEGEGVRSRLPMLLL